uniref:Dysbindin domain-containing protein 1 n=1 Tax=Serinus canaria TaxID=9135 RepID=A0A8C9N0X2_SERCA
LPIPVPEIPPHPTEIPHTPSSLVPEKRPPPVPVGTAAGAQLCPVPAEPLSSVSSLEVHFDLLDLTELTDMSDQELAEVFPQPRRELAGCHPKAFAHPARAPGASPRSLMLQETPARREGSGSTPHPVLPGEDPAASPRGSAPVTVVPWAGEGPESGTVCGRDSVPSRCQS